MTSIVTGTEQRIYGTLSGSLPCSDTIYILLQEYPSHDWIIVAYNTSTKEELFNLVVGNYFFINDTPVIKFTVDKNGYIVVYNPHNAQLKVYSPSLTVIYEETLSSAGNTNNWVQYDMQIGPEGYLYILWDYELRVYSLPLTLIKTISLPVTSTKLNSPHPSNTFCFDSNDNIYTHYCEGWYQYPGVDGPAYIQKRDLQGTLIQNFNDIPAETWNFLNNVDYDVKSNSIYVLKGGDLTNQSNIQYSTSGTMLRTIPATETGLHYKSCFSKSGKCFHTTDKYKSEKIFSYNINTLALNSSSKLSSYNVSDYIYYIKIRDEYAAYISL